MPQEFRPSALPKLAQCIHYSGQETAGAAAARGTRIDALFRAIINGQDIAGDDEETHIARKAATMVLQDAGNAPVCTNEESCRLKLTDDNFNEFLTGTADAICPENGVVYDLKTGEIRNYAEQMAAYALACMNRYGASKWVTKLVFIDQLTIIPREWTYVEAQNVVLGLWTRWQNRHHLPRTPCEYCNWCSFGVGGDMSCTAVKEQIAPVAALEPLPMPLTRELLETNAAAAGVFLRGMSILEKIKEDVVKRAKEGGLLPEGYKLTERTRKEVNIDALASLIERHGASLFIETGAKPSVEALQTWSEQHGEDLPAGAVVTGKPYSVLLPTSRAKGR